MISHQDKVLFKEDNPFGDRIYLAPLGLTLPSLADKVARSDNTLVITGTLNYHPNIASVHYFVREIFPLVLRECPNTQLKLIGANPIAAITALKGAQITVTGFVPSIIDHLKTATVALAPVTYGSGIQVKVLEAFSTATPLVATSVALRGLNARHQQHVLAANSPAEFAAAIVALLSNTELRHRIGTEGRRYVEENHDLRATTQNLVDIYNRVL